MFKDKDKTISELKLKITELEASLNQLANSTENVIIKQLPDGTLELNGEPFANNTEVEYYNSSKATFGELTMFRLGKEVKQREIDKIIDLNMEQVSSLNSTINELNSTIDNLQKKSYNDDRIIKELSQTEINLNDEIVKLTEEIKNNAKTHADKENEIIERYEKALQYLRDDIDSWMKRYLSLNGVTIDESVLTPYGKVINVEKENKNENI